MMRALYTAASGMRAQQTNVDNISNNIANVNTTAFKSQKTEFKSLLYQTIQTRTTSANGEEKPIGAQVGLGTRVASNTTSYTQGALLEDESKSAFAIEGNGFFHVSGADGTTYYTRNGNFNWSIGPTGTTLTKDQLQEWVDYANKVGAVIIYDAAYEAYISEDNVAHSIYECKGARTCAIELRSFSKNAGFTGVRLGFTVVPKDLKCGDVSLNAMWARRHGTKFNGAPYIVQRAGEAVYSAEGKAQLKDQVAYYMKNAKTIKEGLKDAGYTVFGGVNAPYIWLKTPKNMTSWEFFDYLLEKANVVGTPGSGFGPSGEGYFRLTAFGNYENTVKALERIKAL